MTTLLVCALLMPHRQVTATPSHDLKARVTAAATLLVVHRASELIPPKFVIVTKPVGGQKAGVYYELGGIRPDYLTSGQDYVLPELVLQQAWIQALRSALLNAFPDMAFWYASLGQAQDFLDGFMRPENETKKDREVVDTIRRGLVGIKARIEQSVRGNAEKSSMAAVYNPDHGLALKQYKVKITTDPVASEVGYVSVYEAAMQQIANRVKVPEGLSYATVISDETDLGGSYIFRITWDDGHVKYDPTVRVVDSRPLLFKRGPK